MYIFISNSSNVGSHPHNSTILSRIGSKSTNPNLVKKEPIRILTNSGILNVSAIFSISSIDTPNAKNKAIIEPADDPEISFTSTNLDSSPFKTPIIENIPIEAGPKTRYFILLLSRTEEIACEVTRTPQRTQPRESQRQECWSVPTGRHRPSQEGG